MGRAARRVSAAVWVAGTTVLLVVFGPVALSAVPDLMARVAPSVRWHGLAWLVTAVLVFASFALLFGASFLVVRFLGAPRSVWLGVLLAALPFTAVALLELGRAGVAVLSEASRGEGGRVLAQWLVLRALIALVVLFSAGNVFSALFGARLGHLSRPRSNG